MENESILFLYSDLCDSVQGRARQFSEPEIGLKIRRPLRSWGFAPPSRHQQKKEFITKMATSLKAAIFVLGCSDGCSFFAIEPQKQVAVFLGSALRRTAGALERGGCIGVTW